MSWTRERWVDIKALLDRAIQMSADEQAAFLQKLSKDQPENHQILSRMLNVDSNHLQALEKGAFHWDQKRLSPELRPGQTLDQYEILQECGKGGMATVYQARQTGVAFEKFVAIKVLHHASHETMSQQMFERECQILARLDHPNIARILHSGTTPTGFPYLAMAWVDGQELSSYINQRRPSLDVLFQLFLKICQAVQFANRNLVIHSDLKPANILVTEQGEPILLDFGFAKLIPDRLGAEISMTMPHLTPAYASPEQWEHGKITTASDVYSLGIIFFEMLTGQRPSQQWSWPSNANYPVPRQENIQRPSQVLKNLGRECKDANIAWRPFKIWAAKTDGDLDAVTIKALAASPEDRYASAGSLVEDLIRLDKGQPVMAQRLSWRYLTKKFVLRNRLLVAITMMAAFGMLGLILALFHKTKETREALYQAQENHRQSEQISDLVFELLKVPNPYQRKQERLTILQALEGAVVASTTCEGDVALKARLLSSISDIYVGQGNMDQAEEYLNLANSLFVSPEDVKNPEYPLVLARLGQVANAKMEFEKSQWLLEHSVRLFQTKFPDHLEGRAEASHHLSRLYFEINQLERSEKLARSALRHYGSEAGKHQTQRANIHALLGELTLQKDKPEEAAYHLNQALTLAVEANGTAHPTYVHIASQLERLMFNTHSENPTEIASAEALWSISMRWLGRNHPATLTTLVLVAEAHSAAGLTDTAQVLFLQACQGLRSSKDPYNSTYARAALGFAEFLSQNGEFVDAMCYYADAIAIFESIFGDAHPETMGAKLSRFKFSITHLGSDPLWSDLLAVEKGMTEATHVPYWLAEGVIHTRALVSNPPHADLGELRRIYPK